MAGLRVDAEAIARHYREWDRDHRDENGERQPVLEHMDPLEQRDAAWECGCGQRTLPSDRKRTCNCFGNQNAPTNPKLPSSTPDLMTTLTPIKETCMPDTDAPYGYKADGTPKKSNGGRKPKAAAQLAAPPATRTVEPDPIFAAIAELDEQIARRDAQVVSISERIEALKTEILDLTSDRDGIHENISTLKAARDALDDATEIERVAA